MVSPLIRYNFFKNMVKEDPKNTYSSHSVAYLYMMDLEKNADKLNLIMHQKMQVKAKYQAQH